MAVITSFEQILTYLKDYLLITSALNRTCINKINDSDYRDPQQNRQNTLTYTPRIIGVHASSGVTLCLHTGK